MDLMLGTHFTGSGIEIIKCNQDSNHSLSKQVSSKIFGSIDLCIYGGNNLFITPLGFFFWQLEKVEIPNYNKCKLLIFTQKIEECACSEASIILLLISTSIFFFRWFCGILVILEVSRFFTRSTRFKGILVIFMNLRIFLNHFTGFRGILVILEVSRYFR